MPANRNATFDAPAAAPSTRPKSDEDVGADVGVTPGERTPGRDRAPKFRLTFAPFDGLEDDPDGGAFERVDHVFRVGVLLVQDRTREKYAALR